MNCNEARALLAIYRELKKEAAETPELEAHLDSCASCGKELDQYSFIREKIRSLPVIEPSPNAHSRLMQALVVEHSRHLEQTATSTASTPIPEFLIPYLHRNRKGNQQKILHDLASFSSADTGPLPMLPSPRRRRRPSFNQFAILGLAATFLMVLMAGGITGLLALARPEDPPIVPPPAIQISVNQPSSLEPTYPLAYTNYEHIVSAASSRGTIYYTAYGDKSTGWTLERLDAKSNPQDKTPQYSIPVLYNPSPHPLLILGSSQDWLILLQLNNPTLDKDQNPDEKKPSDVVREWSLQALYIGTQPISDQKYYLPVTLQKGTFKEATVPEWVRTPIQGISFVQDTALIAMIDEKGESHLLQQHLNLKGDFKTQELAKATDGRILTSPTSTSDGAYIYWSEEWFDGLTPHSNIWVQETREAEQPLSGRWAPHSVVEQSIFSKDETSFHPLVINDTLFLLNTTPLDEQGKPVANASATPTPAINPALVNRIDPIIYPDQLDEAIQGNLLAFSARTGAALDLPLHVKGLASAIQAGNNFLIWQNSDKSFSMYDVVGKKDVIVGDKTISTKASFLSVNGDTAIWMNPVDPNTPANSQGAPVTFSTFSWPLPDWQAKQNKNP